MKFSLKQKLKRAGALFMACAMVLGLLSAVPQGIFLLGAKADDAAAKTWDWKDGNATYAAEADAVYQPGSSVMTFEWDGLLMDGTQGKVTFRKGQDNGQFNTGARLAVPVSGSSEIEVKMYTKDFTVNGTAADSEVYTYKYDGAAGTVDIVATGNTYVYYVKVTPIVKPTLDTSKTDVWDFGGQALEGDYWNNIDYDVINSCYPGVEAGTAGKNIESFMLKDGAGADALEFVTNKTNNRWRLHPDGSKPVTYYDDKTKKDEDGNEYQGFLYSNNSSATPTSVDPSSTNLAHVNFYLYEGDILTCWLGSNGNAAHYILVDEKGQEVSSFDYSGKNGVEKAVFYGTNEGWYTLYCSNEKLVLARALRQHTPVVTVSGTVTAPEALSTYGLVFTNQKSGSVVKAPVNGGSYSVELNAGYTYDVALYDANGYVIDSDASVEVKDSQTFDVHVKAVDLIKVTGKIEGMPADQLEKLNLVFSSDKIYIPEMKINTSDGSFELSVEQGVEYAVTAENVNDYALDTVTFKADAAQSGAAIKFTKKPVYEAKVDFKGLGDADTSSASVTFTNINEAGYSYTFGINDKMELRDGQYSVKVTGLGHVPYVQGVTANVKIEGKAGSTVAQFTKIDDWDIASLAPSNQIETHNEKQYFAGLELAGSAALNKDTYLLMNADATASIPNVKAGDVITVSYCYSAAFEIAGSDIKVDEKSGSTSQIDKVTYTAAADGPVVIKAIAGQNSTQTYICAINVVAKADAVPYKSVITVGSDKEYKTVGAALDAVRNMDRTADQAVTIMIDPGNYEEMLVIDTPNVVLKNASSAPSIELKNKGVDIDENAVRITWYYGHGYTYYSQGSDSKFHADLLAANKANGYPSYENTGSGTTNGSYWNATVVVTADNVSADGIIFENSFNQYVSAASVEDIIVSQSGAKNGAVKRDDMKTVGDTAVQSKAYVERAAALAIYNNVQKTYFNNCKFIGRQDTLYGGAGATVAFNKCSVYGGTDYIFGGMIAVFKECDLVFNTSEDNNDVGYITAAQQSSGRGYLMYSCHITSTQPGVDTASEYTSKPGYLGRPWQANTAEAVFYNTTIDAADEHWVESFGASLIQPAGWLNTLSGESELSVEYGTVESSGADNSANRAAWAKVLDKPVLADGTEISIEAFLGDWNPFQAKAETGSEITVNDGGVVTDATAKVPDGAVELTEEEQQAVDAGEQLKIEVNFKEASVSAAEQALVAGVLTGEYSECQVGKYIDISLFKVIGSNRTEVAETKQDITITFKIPEDLLNTDSSVKRTYYIVRIHNGEVKMLDVTVSDGNLTFATDLFSTYAIVYKDEAVQNPDNNPSTTDTPSGDTDNGGAGAPQTGDSAAIGLLLALLAISGSVLVLGYIGSRKRKTA